jgi:hypothetical protein
MRFGVSPKDLGIPNLQRVSRARVERTLNLPAMKNLAAFDRAH